MKMETGLTQEVKGSSMAGNEGNQFRSRCCFAVQQRGLVKIWALGGQRFTSDVLCSLALGVEELEARPAIQHEYPAMLRSSLNESNVCYYLHEWWSYD